METLKQKASIHNLSELPPDFDREKMKTHTEDAHKLHDKLGAWTDEMLHISPDSKDRYGYRAVQVEDGEYQIARQPGRYRTDSTLLAFIPKDPEAPTITLADDIDTSANPGLTFVLQASVGNEVLEHADFSTRLTSGEPAILDGCEQFMETAQTEIQGSRIPVAA